MKLRTIALLAGAGLLSSCAAFKGADAPVTMRLSPAFPATSEPKVSRAIAVAPVRARGFAAHTRYVYFSDAKPGEIQQAATLFWEEPPTQVLERALVAGLSRRFTRVAGPGVTMPADWRVVATLTRFEELSGLQSKAMVSFDATTLHAGKVERTGTFCAEAPIADASPSTRAAAFQSAIERAVASFVQDSDDEPTGTTSPAC